MITRIVKMSFRADKVNDFLALFQDSQQRIRNFHGCAGLKLLKDLDSGSTFFTYSLWQSPEHLEQYRNSGLFKEVWQRTKILFSNKPEAWSVEEIVNVGS